MEMNLGLPNSNIFYYMFFFLRNVWGNKILKLKKKYLSVTKVKVTNQG